MRTPHKPILFLWIALISLLNFTSVAQPVDTSAWLYSPTTGMMQRITRGGVLADSFALPMPDTTFDALPNTVVASPNGLTLAYVARATSAVNKNWC